MVIAYRMHWLSFRVIKAMALLDTVTLVNLVSDTRVVPEFLGPDCVAEKIAAAPLGVVVVTAGTYDLTDWETLTHSAGPLVLQAQGAVTFLGGGQDFINLAGGSFTVNGIDFDGFRRVVTFPNDDAAVIDLLSLNWVTCRNAAPSGGLVVYFPTGAGATVIDFRTYQTNVYDSRQGIHYRGRVERADVHQGEWAGIENYAIRFGQDWSAADWCGSVRVRATHIHDLSNPSTSGGTEANGIAVFADFCDVQSNLIERVTNALNQDCEGIYTKVRRGKVDNNTLVDACLDEGAIVAKMPQLDPTDTQGARQQLSIQGNNISFTVLRDFSVGINIQRSNVLCAGNMIDGAGVNAIRVGWRNIYSFITIRGNEIVMGGTGATTGGAPAAAILVYAYGEQVAVEDNAIFGAPYRGIVAATEASGATRYPTGYAPIRTGLKIKRNRIFGTGTRGIDVTLDATEPVAKVAIVGNEVAGFSQYPVAISAPNSSDWRYQDNDLDANTKFFSVPANLRVRGSEFRAAGADSVSSGSTSKTISHGINQDLFAKASRYDVQITPGTGWGTASSWWVSALAAGSLTISVNAAPGASLSFGWRMSLEDRLLP